MQLTKQRDDELAEMRQNLESSGVSSSPTSESQADDRQGQ